MLRLIARGKVLAAGLVATGAVLTVVMLGLAACSVFKPLTPVPASITGKVINADGKAMAGAVVQVKGTPNKTTTARDGSFSLKGEGLGGRKLTTVTAWSDGYFVGWMDLDPAKPAWKSDGSGVDITLKPLYTVDNYQYTWFTFEGVTGAASCALCHRESPEWDKDAHSQSAKNVRFITTYSGTNVKGDKGQNVQFDSKGNALPPDPSQPYYGPGYKLDFYNRTGNCATCHTPQAAQISNEKNCAWSGCHTDLTAERAGPKVMDKGVLPVSLKGTAAEGISCEFCHKINSVILDKNTNLPMPDMPGILSIQLSRPPEGQNVFFGTIVDINRRVSYSAVETQSEFCAPCHYGVFGGVVGMGQVTGGTLIYNSYGEWLNSPYSDPKTGKTCQDCHMPVANTDWTVKADRGGISRPYDTFHDHTMPGVTDEQFMKNAVTMKSSTSLQGGALQVSVSIANDKTGHDVPTDSPSRSMMLVVEAVDASGKTLALAQGPVLPGWTGNFAGQPGKAFAKILKDGWTGETPTVAYWRPVTIAEDTRLAPFATDSSTYTFNLPAGSNATVHVKLIYRRAFQQLEQQKGWNDPDLTMAESTLQVEK